MTTSQQESRKAARKRSKRENDAVSVEMMAVRAREKRVRRIRRRATAVVVVVAVVAAGGAGGWLWWSADDLATYVGPKNMRSDGVLLTGSDSAVTAVSTRALAPKADPVPTSLKKYTSTANFALYLDLADEKSADFLATNGAELESWLAAGYVTVELHPLAAHDSARDGHWSLRSANAVACTANSTPKAALAVADALATAAAKKGFDGMTDAKLVAAVKKAGGTSSAIASCIRSQRFVRWVGLATHRAEHDAIPNSSLNRVGSTPAILVQEQRYTGSVTSTDDLAAFITKVYSSTASAAG